MKKVFVCFLLFFCFFVLPVCAGSSDIPTECKDSGNQKLPVGRLIDKCQLTIRCGYSGDGSPRDCYMGDGHKCFYCTDTQRVDDGTWAGDFWRWTKRQFVGEDHVSKYFCATSTSGLPGDCRAAPKGGLDGETYHTAGFFRSIYNGVGEITGWWDGETDIGGTVATPGHNCIVSNILAIHGAQCYPCAVFEILFIAFMRAAEKAYDVSKEAGNIILFVCTLIWLAFFVLKNVSSFAAVDPMMMLQQMTVQFFKVILAFVIINSGVKTILHYTLVPIVSVGTDIASGVSDDTMNSLFPIETQGTAQERLKAYEEEYCGREE